MGAPELLPSFVILGAQKSASTFLHRCLGEHPQIYMPPGEAALFEDPHYPGRIGELTALYRNAPTGSVLGFKRPELLGVAACAGRLRETIPDAKLLAILRNPVDRAVSAYFHYVRGGALPVRPAEEGLAALLDGRYDGGCPRARQVIDFGFYGAHLRRYRALFPPEQLLVLLDEDFRSDARSALGRVYRYLGVDDGYTPRALTTRPQPGVYALPRLRYLQVTSRIVRATATRPPGSNHRSWLSPPLKAFDRLVLARLCRAEKPQLTAALRERLVGTYAADIRDLEDLLGRDLGAWRR